MDRNKKLRRKKLVKLSYSICSVVLAFLTSVALWYCNVSPYWDEGYQGYFTLFLVGVMFCVVYWFFAKMYQAQKIGLYRLTELSFFQLLSYCFSDVTLVVAMIFWFHGLERIQVWTFIIVFCIQMFVIMFLIFIHNRIFRLYDEPQKIIIVYGNDTYHSLMRKMENKKRRYQIVECLDDHTEIEEIQNLIDICDGIYLYEVRENIRKDLIIYCDKNGKTVYLTCDMEYLLTKDFDVSHTFDIPLIRSKRVPEKWYYAFIKRLIDIVFSGLGLIVLSPVFLITAIGIKLYDHGPVFYKQIRLTKNHKEFKIYKFRSMITDAEKNGVRFASQNDERITPIGKIIRATRIDELPQLVNILKGDMTIVGPRPERPEIEKVYLEKLPEFALRLNVKAGLTGYAQIFGKYNTTPLDKLKLDLIYINNRSILLDFKLIFYTVKIIFMPESTEGFVENEAIVKRVEL